MEKIREIVIKCRDVNAHGAAEKQNKASYEDNGINPDFFGFFIFNNREEVEKEKG